MINNFLKKYSKIELPKNERFGYFFGFVFIVVSIFCFYNNLIIMSYFSILLSFSLFLISIIKPNILYPLNVAWMYLGLLIGEIVNPIIIGFIFFGIITPLSLFFHIIKRDQLKLRRTEKQSFWIKRDNEYNNNDFFNQF